MRRTQEERRDETERRVVDAALALIERHGTHQLTLAQVGTAAGCSRGIVHHRFGGREQLVAAVVCAGHPRPVLLAGDGRAREVGAAAPLLGVFEQVQAEPERVRVAPEETLIIFSDGLTDVGRRLGRRDFEGLDALQGMNGRSAAEVVTRLEQVAEIADRPDDVCVLAVRRVPRSAPSDGDRALEPSAPADPAAAVGLIEAAFREDDERLVAGRPTTEQTVSVTCECGHTGCSELVDVPHERVRADDRAVVREHGAAGETAEQAAP